MNLCQIGKVLGSEPRAAHFARKEGFMPGREGQGALPGMKAGCAQKGFSGTRTSKKA